MKALATLAAALPLLAASSFADTLVVQQLGAGFVPREITVEIGDTVRWTWTSGSHDVTEGTDGTVDGNEAFHGPLNAGNQVFEVTFDQAFLDAWPRPGNRYDYFCTPHFGVGMTGVVIVSDGAGVIFCHCDGDGAFPACFNFAYWGEGCRNSTFQGARLREHGSASLAADDMSFDADRLLPGQAALLFAGESAVAGGHGVSFGDGLRCAGVNVVRLGIRTPGAGGDAHWGPGLAGPAGFQPGDLRFLQVWYRDPVNGPCGSGFNLTNGIQVTYVP